jgi:hypothetical protein
VTVTTAVPSIQRVAEAGQVVFSLTSLSRRGRSGGSAPPYARSALAKYAALVGPADQGAGCG